MNGEKIFTSWQPFKANLSQSIVLTWASGQNADLRLAVNGHMVGILRGDTSASVLEEVWLGPSGELTPDAYGSEYFDGFVSVRGLIQIDFPYKVFLPAMVKP